MTEAQILITIGIIYWVAALSRLSFIGMGMVFLWLNTYPASAGMTNTHAGICKRWDFIAYEINSIAIISQDYYYRK